MAEEEDPFGFVDDSGEAGALSAAAQEDDDPFQGEDDGPSGYDAFGEEAGDVQDDDAFGEVDQLGGSTNGAGGGLDAGSGLGGEFETLQGDGEIDSNTLRQDPPTAGGTNPLDLSIGTNPVATVSGGDDNGALRAFERKWQAEIQEKDAKHQAEKERLREVAQQELAKHVAEVKSRLEAKAKANRIHEEELANAINEALTAENPWERITTLVDTGAPKEKVSKDPARMRGLLIQLKNEPLPQATA